MEQRLSLDDVARYPRPGMSVPHHFEFIADSRQLIYLHSAEATLTQQLWTYDIATGERRRLTGAETEATSRGAFSLEEELQRERNRQRETGVTEFACARDGESGLTTLLVPMDGCLYVAHEDGPLERLQGSDGAHDARLSPDGSWIAFVRQDELYSMPAQGGGPARRLTSGAGNGVTNGLAEYIAQEEMGRQEGFWWSPDGTRLAFVRADSSHIPLYPIVHQGRVALSVEEHRYPFAGARNAAVRLGMLKVTGDDTPVTWMDLGADDDMYLARVAWRPDGVLTAQVESRDQRQLRLLAFDGKTGTATTLIEEQGTPWINLSDDTRFLASGEIVWSSEKSGFRHLYLHDAQGRERRALTAGDWMVTGLASVDEQRRIVYFHGTRDGVLERHLYAVSLDGGTPWRVTEGAGWHEAVVSPDGRYFVDTWSRAESAPLVTLHGVEDGGQVATLHEPGGNTAADLGLCVPELMSFTNREGVELYAAVYVTPAVRASSQRHPLIVAVYGGPHVQAVANRWDMTVDLRAQFLAQHGFVVLKVDNRGSADRGLAFESALARHMGHVEVDDQVDGVRFLAERSYVDGERVAIYGWSYGGYMTCRALLLAPEVFKVGIAGAPVTAWEGYDTHYTERYMGRPDDNAEGYRNSSVMAHVKALRGKLLIVHGMVDENVHFRHSVRLMTALAEAGKSYDVVLFPEERHMPRDARDLQYLEKRLVEYLQRHL